VINVCVCGVCDGCSGRVRVVFTNLKDNNSFVKAVEGQVVEIVKQAFARGRLQASSCFLRKVLLFYRIHCFDVIYASSGERLCNGTVSACLSVCPVDR